ncbi:uncharacterized protein RCC_04536 [Ramularia collo-cygni]|uniref:BTB domain-containing protein n=1 Tax=Ramularia collo-cygni TaxID=112498 RepID=A0A2D3UPV8_9PEZI|nr:uncharacterized protein RCC_04536 [Ramularia collo-cygni]CZT18692.1 uncharacterized protein RCC_04536 [Ramularia collo-cygni]
MTDTEDIRILEQDRFHIDGDIVIVKAGTRNQNFPIHVCLLNRSEFFRHKLAVLAAGEILQLAIFEGDKDAAVTFALYVHLIYYETLPYKVAGPSTVPSLKQVHLEQMAIMKLYIMAQKLGDGGAMDAAVSTLLATSQEPCSVGKRCNFTLPSTEVVQKAYAHTSTASPIRRLMVDMYLWWAAAEHIDERYPTQFVVSVAKAGLDSARGARHTGYGSFAQASCCDYHQHEPHVVCSSRKMEEDLSSGEGTDEDYVGDG